MLSHLRTRTSALVLCLTVGMAISGSAWAAEEAKVLIDKGWEEYGFLSLDSAKKYFDKALEAGPDADQEREATMGLAMVLQYRERNPDLSRAESLYRAILDSEPPEEVEALVLSNLADLHLARGEEAESLGLLNTLTDTSLDTVIGQEALRRWILIQVPEFGTAESVEIADQAAAKLEALDGTRERPFLLPLLHDQIGSIYFWAEEYAKAVKHFEVFSLIGSADNTNYGSQSSNLYRLAQINERFLGDQERATHFYRRLVEEYPNSDMVFFALENAVAHGGLSRDEVRSLRLAGVTEEILDSLFANAPVEAP